MILLISVCTGHTALLRVYNDIVTTIGRGNGAMLVLHLTPLIMIICFAYWKNMSEFVVMLKLIKSYFSNRIRAN